MKMIHQRFLIQILTVLSTIILLLVLPTHNLYTISLAIISVSLTHKLYWEIRLGDKPNAHEYREIIGSTTFWVMTFMLLIQTAGALGWAGLWIFTIGLAAWKIWRGRVLFNTYTNWAADLLWGRTKERFNLDTLAELAIKEGEEDNHGKQDELRRGTEETNLGSGRGEDSYHTQQPLGDGGEPQGGGKNQEAVQTLLPGVSSLNEDGGVGNERQALPTLSKDIRSRKSVDLIRIPDWITGD